MPKIRRGGYVFLAWKWDLDNRRVMRGIATPRLRALIEQLEAEGRL